MGKSGVEEFLGGLLYCDAIPCLSSCALDDRLGVETNSLSSQSQKQSVQSLRRKGRDPGVKEKPTMRIPVVERTGQGPFYLLEGSFPYALSTEMPNSSCLFICQSLKLQLGGFCANKKYNTRVGDLPQ